MRVSRAAQVEANRGEVLAAARRVFLARGYAGATLDAIADAAGFSKGVVYSQFGGKADLFLALLAQRIEERAAHEVTGWRGVMAAPDGVPAWNPAFDVTPAELISAIITDRGVLAPRDVTRAID